MMRSLTFVMMFVPSLAWHTSSFAQSVRKPPAASNVATEDDAWDNYGQDLSWLNAMRGPVGADIRDKVLSYLLSSLQDHKYSYAAERLGELKDPAAVMPLIAALADERARERELVSSWDRSQHQQIREQLVIALKRIGDARAIEPMIEVVENEAWEIKRHAIEFLGTMQDRRAVRPLVTLLRFWGQIGKGWPPEWEAPPLLMESLKAMGEAVLETSVQMLQDKDPSLRKAAARALGELGDSRAVTPLITALGDEGNHEVWEAVAVSLRRLKDPRAVEPLVAALKHEDTKIRQWAAAVLGDLEDRRALGPLVAAIGSEDSELRERAAVSLVKLKDPRAVEPLIAALKYETTEIRECAAIVLGHLEDRRAVEPLIALIEEEDNSAVRACIARALASLADSRATRTLIGAMQDEHPNVRAAAAASLTWISDTRAAETAISTWQRDGLLKFLYREENLGAVQAAFALFEKTISAALNDDDPHVRSRAVLLLGRVKNRRARELLVTAMDDEDLTVRNRVTFALCRHGAVEPLVAMTKDEEYDVRRCAYEQLEDINDPLAVMPLIKALKHQDYGVRRTAATALGRLRDSQAVEPLIAALEDEDNGVRYDAVKSLASIGDRRVVEALIAALDRDSIVSEYAAEALASIGDLRAVEPLIAAMNRAEDNRHQLAIALGRFCDARAAEALTAVGLIGWADEALAAADPERAIQAILDSDSKWCHFSEAPKRALFRLGWRPETADDAVRLLASDKEKDLLLVIWPYTKKSLLDHLYSTDGTWDAARLLILLGRDEVLPDLLSVLRRRGTRHLALLYLNSGKGELQSAGQTWADKHGIGIIQLRGKSREPTWCGKM